MTAPSPRAAAASRRLAAALVAGDAGSLALIADALRRDDGRLAKTLGLSAPGRPRADRGRDELIQKMRAHYSGVSAAEAAQRIATAWRRYEQSSWRHDCGQECNPYGQGPQGMTPRALLWSALKAGHRAPSAATIRRRIAAAQKRT